MPAPRRPDALLALFATRTVVDLPTIQHSLGDVSAMTAFRYLKQVPHRRSYDNNGRFYSLFDPALFDRCGLWGWGNVHFSVDGSLRDTVRRIVRESEAGSTQRELQQLLRVRVHNSLLDLVHKAEIDRQLVAELFVYVHKDPGVRALQLQRRGEHLDAGKAPSTQQPIDVEDAVVIQVLLVLIRHPGSKPADIVRRMRGHLPPITFDQVCAVFRRYDLDDLGEKGGSRNF